MISTLSIQNWRQFKSIKIDFHPRLTILTGVNGSGKTTLLHLLNQHWGWNLHFVSGPTTPGNGISKYQAGFWNGQNGIDAQPASAHLNRHAIGEISYAGRGSSTLYVPGDVGEVFDVLFDPKFIEPGVYVPSHRPPYVFQKVNDVPVSLGAREQIFEQYLFEVVGRYTGDRIGQAIKSPSFLLKRSLMSLAMFGYGNEAVEPNHEAIRIFEGFQEILRIMLPESLGFKKIKVRMPDVLFETETGDFALEAVSGGIAAIVDMAWQIHMYAQIKPEFVVVIDEPEAHLHPALQQRLLPDLLRAFPQAQFVIATHNPLMVTSVPDSHIYALRYNEDRKVESEKLDPMTLANTVDETLMDVLGMAYTIPIWAQSRIDLILKEFGQSPLTQASVSSLKSKMNELGMGRHFPEVLAKVAESQP